MKHASEIMVPDVMLAAKAVVKDPKNITPCPRP